MSSWTGSHFNFTSVFPRTNQQSTAEKLALELKICVSTIWIKSLRNLSWFSNSYLCCKHLSVRISKFCDTRLASFCLSFFFPSWFASLSIHFWAICFGVQLVWLNMQRLGMTYSPSLLGRKLYSQAVVMLIHVYIEKSCISASSWVGWPQMVFFFLNFI